ncbi:hypothetical protein DFQ26_003042 [Actinomortierella ambigua]|nr:hypothetical protein DFQ26_003042 [Actinomortierella ambigua]
MATRTTIVLAPVRAPVPPKSRGHQPDPGTDPPPNRIPFQQLIDLESPHWNNQPNQKHFQTRINQALLDCEQNDGESVQGTSDPLNDAFVDPELRDGRERTYHTVAGLLRHGLIVTQDDSRRDVSTFIKRHFLGETSEYRLQLDIHNEGTEEIMAVKCPPNTRLLFSHLASTLHAKIYIFSNRAAPRLYGSPEAKTACAFLHVVDSFLGTSEYLTLSFANHKTKRMLRRQSVTATTQQPRSAPPGYPAQYRETQRARHKASPFDHSDAAQNELIHSFEIAWRGGSGTPSEERLAEVKAQLTETLDAIASIFQEKRQARLKPNDRALALDDECLALLFWLNIFGDKFDDVWSGVYNNILLGAVTPTEQPSRPEAKDSDDDDDDDDDDNDGDGDDDRKKVETRTCTATLKQTLRPELRDNPVVLSRIVELLEQMQCAATNLEDEIYELVHKELLVLASGNMWSDNPGSFDLSTLLPPGFELGTPERTLSVAPLPDGLQDEVEAAIKSKSGSELVNLFSQNHLSKLAHHFSSSTMDGRLHIESVDGTSPSFWTRLAQKVFAASSCQPLQSRSGMSKTGEAHIRQCSTMINNLLHGSVYTKSLDYLLRFLLRAWLAPCREASNKERRSKHVGDKKALVQERLERRAGRLTPSHWRHAMRKLCDELADCDQVDSIAQTRRESAIRRRRRLMRDIAALSKKDPGQRFWDQHPIKPLDDSAHLDDFEARGEHDPPDGDDSDDDDSPELLQEDLDHKMLIDKTTEASVELLQVGLDHKMLIDKTTEASATSSPATMHAASESTPTTSPSVREPSRKQLQSLQVVLRTLIESPSPLAQYSLEDVKNAVYKDHNFAEAELEVVRDLANKLRPFCPRRCLNDSEGGYRQHSPNAALRAPIIVLANAVMRAMGHSDFTRRICPHIAAGDTHALHLGPQQLFETLCASSPRHFDVQNADNNPITNTTDVTADRRNKRCLMEAFFDMTTIDSICGRHGLKFNNRQTTTDDDPLRHPITSNYQSRCASNDGKWRRLWQEQERQGLTQEDVAQRIAEAKENADTIKKQLDASRRRFRQLQSQAKGAIQIFNEDKKNRNNFISMKEHQQDARRASKDVSRLVEAQSNANKEAYFWRKIESAAKAATRLGKKTVAKKKKTVGPTTPSWKSPGSEDVPQHIDASPLLGSHGQYSSSGRKNVVVCWTEDPGVRVMSHNVPRTIEELQRSVNQFEALQNLATSAMDVDTEDDGNDLPGPNKTTTLEARSHSEVVAALKRAQAMKLPAATKVTAKHLNQVSFTTKFMKTRERALADPKNVAASDALKAVSTKEAALSSATTIAQIDKAAGIRRLAKGELRKFNDSRNLKKLRRTKRHRNSRALAKMASHVRDNATKHALNQQKPEPEHESMPSSVDQTTGYCSNCEEYEMQKVTSGCFQHPTSCVKHRPQVVHIGFVGDSGSGVGSRIGGHVRRGGGRLRAAHRQHAVVAITDEYLSSQRCPLCFERTRPARSRRKKRDGSIKTVSVKGSMECRNHDCPSFCCGYATKPRDSQGSFNIGTNGYSLLTTKRPLDCFSRYEHQRLIAGAQTRAQLQASGAMDTPQWGYF